MSTTTFITNIPPADRRLYVAMMKKMGWLTKTLSSQLESNDSARATEIIFEAKQAIAKFRTGKAEIQSLDSLLQETK